MGAGCLYSEGVVHSAERSKGPEWCQEGRVHSLQSPQLLSNTCESFNYMALQEIFIIIIFADYIYIDDRFPSNVFQSTL